MGTLKNRLDETVLMRWFFEHPKHIFKLMDKKIIAILYKLFLFNWPYEFATILSHNCLKDMHLTVLVLACINIRSLGLREAYVPVRLCASLVEGIMKHIHVKSLYISISGSGGDISYLQLRWPVSLAKQNHLRNFARRHYREHSCEIILN